jgi:hypothetical protein
MGLTGHFWGASKMRGRQTRRRAEERPREKGAGEPVRDNDLWNTVHYYATAYIVTRISG